MNFLRTIKAKEIVIFSVILFFFLTFELWFYFCAILMGNDYDFVFEIPTLIPTFLKYLLLIIFFIVYYRKYLKEKLKDFKINFKEFFKISFKDWFTGFIIMYVSNLIIAEYVGNIGSNEKTVQNLISSMPFIALLLTTVLAPFIEEMIFRKNLQDCFTNKYLFMIISGFIFGFVHILDSVLMGNYIELLLLIPYGSLGFMFAHTLSKTNNIYCTIMMHAIHNGFLTLLAIVGNSL